MRITILGGGKIGYTIAENLANEDHDITIIDTNETAIEKINEELDVLCIKGNGASISVLKEADVGSADVLIATTGRDEINMIACLVGKNLGAKYAIARIRDFDYVKELELLKKNFKIDLTINPELATASHISRLIRFKAATDIETFYHGRVELVGFKARQEDGICGKSLSDIRSRPYSKSILFCAVSHKGETIIPNGSTVISSGDDVFIIGTTIAISQFFHSLGRNMRRIKQALIVGGGKIAANLTRHLQSVGISVKIIEQNYSTCIALSEMLPKAIIISGDGTDQNLLELENIEDYDCFLSLTGRDEDNIITSLFAKQRGVSSVIAKVNRQNYLSIIDSLDIDSVVSPKLITAYGIIRTVRAMLNSHGSKMITLHKIAGGEAEAMEFAISSKTRNLGVPLKNLKLKSGILVAVIIRDGRPIIPEGNDCIKEFDNVILVSRGRQVLDINDIFES